ncbi:MAG TPA: hypothetical protein VE777_21505 [Gaiellales bacterium]|nr:hypothetical protein [Gaiellales bacterium]
MKRIKDSFGGVGGSRRHSQRAVVPVRPDPGLRELIRRPNKGAARERAAARLLELADRQLAERITAVDEQPGAGSGGHGDAVESLLANLRVTTIKGADPDGEDKVVWLFVRLQLEIFDCDVADAHAARRDFVGRGGFGLRDRRAGPVDAEDVAGHEPGRDGSCRRAGPAPDLEHAGVRL